MTTEDEVMRLLRRADPDSGRADTPSVDGTDYLAALRTRSTSVTLIDTEPTPTQPEGRHRSLIIAAAAAAAVAIVVSGLVIATRSDDPIRDVAANQPTTVAQPGAVEILPPDETWGGATRGEWDARSVQRAFSMPEDVSPNSDHGLRPWTVRTGLLPANSGTGRSVWSRRARRSMWPQSAWCAQPSRDPSREPGSSGDLRMNCGPAPQENWTNRQTGTSSIG